MGDTWNMEPVEASLDAAANNLPAANDPSAANNDANEDWVTPIPYQYNTDNNGRGANTEWAGSACIYEWDGEEGDVGPEYPALEDQLFGPLEERKEVRGLDFAK